MNFFKGLIMAFKKISKSHLAQRKLADKKAQAIFEYVILTAIVVAAVLIFTATPYYQQIKTACNTSFNNAVAEIVK